MNYLLDTNVISEIQKERRCNANVAAWYGSVCDDSLYLSVLAIGEIRRGIERLRTRSRERAETLDKWLKSIVDGYADRVLSVDRDVADEWGRLAPHRSIPIMDSLMAATARIHRLTFVTRNVVDAAGLGATTLNPFEYGKP